jgi:hypothetical protein
MRFTLESPRPMQSLLAEPVPYGRVSTAKLPVTWKLWGEQTAAKLQPNYAVSSH